VQGVSSADVARDVTLGVVSTLPTGYREQHTHLHSRRVRRFVFWGWGGGVLKGVFRLLTKDFSPGQTHLNVTCQNERNMTIGDK
jgi:hypothetical protein